MLPKRSSLPVICLRNRELLKVMIINDSKLKFEMSWSDFGIPIWNGKFIFSPVIYTVGQ